MCLRAGQVAGFPTSVVHLGWHIQVEQAPSVALSLNTALATFGTMSEIDCQPEVMLTEGEHLARLDGNRRDAFVPDSPASPLLPLGDEEVQYVLLDLPAEVSSLLRPGEALVIQVRPLLLVSLSWVQNDMLLQT